jgi:hypothetical protein
MRTVGLGGRDPPLRWRTSSRQQHSCRTAVLTSEKTRSLQKLKGREIQAGRKAGSNFAQDTDVKGSRRSSLQDEDDVALNPCASCWTGLSAAKRVRVEIREANPHHQCALENYSDFLHEHLFTQDLWSIHTIKYHKTKRTNQTGSESTLWPFTGFFSTQDRISTHLRISLSAFDSVRGSRVRHDITGRSYAHRISWLKTVVISWVP